MRQKTLTWLQSQFQVTFEINSELMSQRTVQEIEDFAGQNLKFNFLYVNDRGV